MHLRAFIVSRECDELAETEVCRVHVPKIGELLSVSGRTCRTLQL